MRGRASAGGITPSPPGPALFRGFGRRTGRTCGFPRRRFAPAGTRTPPVTMGGHYDPSDEPVADQEPQHGAPEGASHISQEAWLHSAASAPSQRARGGRPRRCAARRSVFPRTQEARARRGKLRRTPRRSNNRGDAACLKLSGRNGRDARAKKSKRDGERVDAPGTG